MLFCILEMKLSDFLQQQL